MEVAMSRVPQGTDTVKAGQVVRPVFDPDADAFVLAAFPKTGKGMRLLPTLTLDWLYEPDATKTALLKAGAVVSSSCEVLHV
jgi:hypothetical protein